MQADSHRSAIVRFGPFELLSDRQLLVRAGKAVPLGRKAISILIELVENAGVIVSKEQLMNAAWPNIFVHESSLKVAISSLRQSLRDSPSRPIYIATEPGLGYRFVAQVARETVVNSEVVPAADGNSTLIPPEPQLIGRESDIAAVIAAVKRGKMTTLLGAGGVGKTAISIAAAHRLANMFDDGVCFVDLSAINHDMLVPATVASQLGLRGSTEDLTGAIADVLSHQARLIILDNCEHVGLGVRLLATRLMNTGIKGAALATSREPIGCPGERLLHVLPLTTPGDQSSNVARDPLACSSVELFLTRLREWTQFVPSPDEIPDIAQLCNVLDGLPLAIEICAAQMTRGGPKDIFVELPSQIANFDNVKAMAPMRQRTLWATIDWSYELLSPIEAEIFRAVAAFTSRFDINDVIALLEGLGLDAYQVTIGIGALVAKSLIVAQLDESAIAYRMLDSTRMFAIGKLRASEDHGTVMRNYSRQVLKIFVRAESERYWRDANQWRRDYQSRLSDLRQALGWCFDERNDLALGFALATAAVDLWYDFAYAAEDAKIDQALDYASIVPQDEQSVAKLAYTRAWRILYGPKIIDSEAFWAFAIERSISSGEIAFELKALWGYAAYLGQTGKSRQAFEVLDRYHEVAVNVGSAAVATGDWLYAQTEVFVGALGPARARLEPLLHQMPLEQNGDSSGRFFLIEAIFIRMNLAPVLWLCGLPDQAARISQDVAAVIRYADHLTSWICFTVWADLPIAYWERDTERFAALCEELHRNLQLEHIPIWHPTLRFHKALADFHRGDRSACIAMGVAVDEVIDTNQVPRVPMYLGMLAEALLSNGSIAEARGRIKESFDVIERIEAGWIRPEIMRVSAAIHVAEGATAAAEDELRKAISLSLEMEAFGLALRAANDLAALLIDKGLAEDAILLLEPVYTSFSEGFGTYDVNRAANLLQAANVLSSNGSLASSDGR